MEKISNWAILVNLLAQTDALFVPVRNFVGNRRAAAASARQRFKESGIPWASRAKTELARKRAQRGIESLAGSGHVTIFRQTGKTGSVKLTDAGEREARFITGVGGEHSSFCTMRELADISSPDGPQMLDRWVPETKLTGFEWGDNRPEALTEMIIVYNLLAWALIRDLVTQNTTMQGHCYYRITSAGWEKLLESDWSPEPDRLDYDLTAANSYEATLRAAIARLEGAPRTQEIGPIPLPVSMADLPYPERRAAAAIGGHQC